MITTRGPQGRGTTGGQQTGGPQEDHRRTTGRPQEDQKTTTRGLQEDQKRITAGPQEDHLGRGGTYSSIFLNIRNRFEPQVFLGVVLYTKA